MIWTLKITLCDGKQVGVAKFEKIRDAEIKREELLKAGYTEKSETTIKHYPAHSIEIIEITKEAKEGQ